MRVTLTGGVPPHLDPPFGGGHFWLTGKIGTARDDQKIDFNSGVRGPPWSKVWFLGFLMKIAKFDVYRVKSTKFDVQP